MSAQHRVHRRSVIALVGLIGAFAALSAAAAAQGTWRGERSRRGDTSIVRTMSGSVWRDTMTLVPELAIGSLDGADPFLFSGQVWSIDIDAAGNIYVLDSKANEVRVFSAAGAHVRTLGRKGGGPGEFENALAMGVTRDGRVVVRDNSGRMSVFSAAGNYTSGWTLGAGFSTNSPFYLTADERLFNPTFIGKHVWYDLSGKARDTIPNPQRGAPRVQLVVLSGGGRASYGVAYMPGTEWTLTRDGQMIIGNGAKYEIDVARAGGGVLRIERAVAPVPVPSAEARGIRESMTARMRRQDPQWTWTVADIPLTKPLFDAVVAGRDGSIWVLRDGPSRLVDNPERDARRPQTGPAQVWESATFADVFDAEGRFLGTVRPPKGVSLSRGIVAADKVVALTTHADGYPQVVRFRVGR